MSVVMRLLRLTDEKQERITKVKANCLLYSFAESSLPSIIGLSDPENPKGT